VATTALADALMWFDDLAARGTWLRRTQPHGHYVGNARRGLHAPRPAVGHGVVLEDVLRAIHVGRFDNSLE